MIGFGNIVSQVVLFMSIMIVIVVLSIVYKTYVTTTNLSLKIQQEQVVSRIDTSFSILNVTYDSSDDDVYFYLENTGSVKLNPDLTDVFLDGARIPRNMSLLDVEILSSSNLVNYEHWDPGETLKLNLTQTLSAGSHIISVATENGVSRTTIFTV